MGGDYNDDIAQGVNYLLWLQIKIVKNYETTTRQQRKDRTVTIQATNLITYVNELFATSIL